LFQIKQNLKEKALKLIQSKNNRLFRAFNRLFFFNHPFHIEAQRSGSEQLQFVHLVRKDGFKLEGGVNCLKYFSQTFQS